IHLKAQSMTQRVLILGGRGRIGSQVTHDLLTHTDAQIVITGTARSPHWENPFPSSRVSFAAIALADEDALRQAIATADLVIHCVGPFHHRDQSVLTLCIEQGVNYLDVSDNLGFTRKVLSCDAAATERGVTAIVNSGIFPGISNSMARQGVEQFEQPQTIHISYVVGGSGGAGLTVLRTTFLGLLHPLQAWVDAQWQSVQPYSDRQAVDFPAPFHRAHVYWYEMPETATLAETFPVHTVVTKFGSVPDLYNHLTWLTARLMPKAWLQHPPVLEALSQISYRMTQVSDRFSGTGVAICCEVTGNRQGQPTRYRATLVHPDTAAAAGSGTGSIAELMLSGKLHKPGVSTVEAAIPTSWFEAAMQRRNIHIEQHIEPL
ncbi:MAG TPA: saccharopine dehydrogenase NADP-binding domain-containing protein, partial [Chroococcidiopsis sp.]